MTEEEKIDFKKFTLENFNLISIAEAGNETDWIRNDIIFTNEFKNKYAFKALKTCIENQTTEQYAFNIGILLMEALWLKNLQKK